MKHLTIDDINRLDRIKRLTLINSITGIKPANLIGTKGPHGTTNLAIFSSVVHLGSNPALIGFILRPLGEVPRHSFENIQHHSYYTINHISKDHTEQAHYTSAKFDNEVSEFEKCNFTEQYIDDFPAPFVKESPLKYGLKFEQAINIELNGTSLIIGSLQHLLMPESFEDNLNLQTLNSVGISGLNSYYQVQKIAQYPYARVSEVPNFEP